MAVVRILSVALGFTAVTNVIYRCLYRDTSYIVAHFECQQLQTWRRCEALVHIRHF